MLNLLIDSLDHPFFGFYKNEYKKDSVFDRDFITTEDIFDILHWDYSLASYYRCMDFANELGLMFTSTYSFNQRKRMSTDSLNIPLDFEGLYYISYLLAKEQQRYWEQIKQEIAFVIVLDNQGKFKLLSYIFNIVPLIIDNYYSKNNIKLYACSVKVDAYPVRCTNELARDILPVFKDSYSPKNFKYEDDVNNFFIRTFDYNSFSTTVGIHPRDTVSLNITEYIRNWFNRDPYITFNLYQEKVNKDNKNKVFIPEWQPEEVEQTMEMIEKPMETFYTLDRMVDKKENEKAYKAFEDYLTNRDLDSLSNKLSIARSVLDKWSIKYYWPDRANLFDNKVNQGISNILKDNTNIVKVDKAFGIDLDKNGLISSLNEKVEKANKQAYDAELRASELEHRLNCLEEGFDKYKQDTKRIIELLLDNNKMINDLSSLVELAIDRIAEETKEPEKLNTPNTDNVVADNLPQVLIEAQADKKNFAKKSLKDIEDEIRLLHPGYDSVIGWAIENKQRYTVKFKGIPREVGRLCHEYCNRFNIKQHNFDLKGDGNLIGFYPKELIKTVVEYTNLIQVLSENPINGSEVAKLNRLQINQYIDVIHKQMSENKLVKQ